MNRWLRNGIIILSILILTLLLIPMLFKGKIQQLITTAVNQQIKGNFTVENIGLSFLTRFPNAHVYMEDFTLTGIESFEGDTLAQGKRLDLIVNPFSVWSSDGISINKIVAQEPRIHAMILDDGQANWDVARVDTVTVDQTEGEPASYRFNLKSYEIRDAVIVYEDALTPMKMFIDQLNHSGSGAFTEVDYDLKTQTKVRAFTVDYQGIEYLSEAMLDADVNMHVNTTEDIVVELLDNVIYLNDLGVKVDGQTTVGEEIIGLDLSFSAAEKASVKSIFSLIPGAYTQDFDEVKTRGSLSFKGMVKGNYSESQLPGFDVALQIEEGMVQYPDLPKAISDINLDLKIENPDGNLNHTVVLINQFDAMMGDDPFHAVAEIRGLENMFIQGEMNGILDLGQLAQVIPLEGNELRGILNVDAEAEGYYNEVRGTFPEVNARLEMVDGYVKSADYPEAELKDIQFESMVSDVDGQMRSAKFEMPVFSFDLGGEQIQGSLTVVNFNDPMYDLSATGNLDLEKLMKIYPMEGMDLRGRIAVKDLNTRGRLSDVEAERYDRLPTSGDVSVSNIYYASDEIPHPISIESGHGNFTPQRLELDNVIGKAGDTDFNINGYLENYLSYVLMGGKQLSGTWILKSNRVNINEWMTDVAEESGDKPDEAAEPYGVVPVPEGIEMLIQADIGQIDYRNLSLRDMEGILTIADQEVAMEGLAFGMLGGQVSMRGNYVTQDIDNPRFSLDLDVNRLGFSEAVQNLILVEKFAPIARLVQGFFNTQLSLKGSMDENMYPILEDITSEGVFEVIEGKIADLPLLNRIATKTKLQNLADLTLDHVKGQFSIREGSVFLDPFTIQKNDIQMTFAGSQNISGSMDYTVQLDMPKGRAGEAVFSALADVIGPSVAEQDSISLLLNVGGTLKDPSITSVESQTVSRVKDQLVDQAESKLEEKIGKDIEWDRDSLKKSIDEAGQAGKDTLKQKVEEKKQQAKDSISTLAEEKKEDIKEEIDKTIEEKIGKEGKDKLDELKKKFGFPATKKKQNNDN